MPKTSCWESVEVVECGPRERSSERMCEQSEVIKETSTQDQIWQRAAEQELDDWVGHELVSRFLKMIRSFEGEESFETCHNKSIVSRNFQVTDAPATGEVSLSNQSHVACVSNHRKTKKTMRVQSMDMSNI